MKKTVKTRDYSRAQVQATNIAWAVCLLSPLPVLASGFSTPAFHISLFVSGWLAWAYTEYFVHRFVMHQGNTAKGLGKLLNHNHHHTDPHDIRVNNFHRSLMIAGCGLATFLSIACNNYATLFCGYMVGFTAYSHMHVILHYRWSEKLFPGLHRFHLAHHCKHPDKCFGVVITWWDHLFGTAYSQPLPLKEKIKDFYYKNGGVKIKNSYRACDN